MTGIKYLAIDLRLSEDRCTQYNLDYQHSVCTYRCNAHFKLFIDESLLSEPRSKRGINYSHNRYMTKEKHF